MTRRMLGMSVGIAIVVGFALAGGAANAAEFKYVGAKKCRTCHKKELIGNQYGVWQEAGHAKAFETLKGEKALEIAQTKGLAVPPSEAAECLTCHATAQGLEPAQIDRKPLKLADGVQCESCHGPGSGYRKKKTMADHDKAIAAGLLIPDEQTCVECHNDESPTWDPAKYTLADGSSAGFDYEQAFEEIKHPIPEDVKGRYLEVEKERRGAGAAEEEEEEED